jgi:hypothetical protein
VPQKPINHADCEAYEAESVRIVNPRFAVSFDHEEETVNLAPLDTMPCQNEYVFYCEHGEKIDLPESVEDYEIVEED